MTQLKAKLASFLHLLGLPRARTAACESSRLEEELRRDNPLAGIKQDFGSAPRWENIKPAVLQHAQYVEEADFRQNQVKSFERGQLATAIALFIVIAICVLGLILPWNSGTGSDGTMRANYGESNNQYASRDVTLASVQHP